ncbi:uncharacterized protein [Argopecten irradians]|uniref:uncharacterized protein isoform X2 n=1 Tax=Argopecten irradians TaxID=31199 RepID=UPI003717DAFE
MYTGSSAPHVAGDTGSSVLVVGVSSLIIIVVVASCIVPRCKKKTHRELQPRVTIERKRAISVEDESVISNSSKSAPKKPIRHSPSTHSNKQKNVQNYENVFIGVYRGNFASPSVSAADTSDAMDNVSSASDPFLDPKEDKDAQNRLNYYEEQCDKALERHISVRQDDIHGNYCSRN